MTEQPRPTAPRSLPAERDPRFDFVRGLCLLVIFSAHINPNFVKKLINGSGFSDAGEAFVFLSGYVAGISFHRLFTSQGFVACQLKALRRALVIYAAHLITLFATLNLVCSVMRDVDLQSIRADLFVTDPAWAFLRTFLLAYFPSFFDILPLFIPLLVALPAVLWLNARLGTYGMLFLSFALYSAAQLFPEWVTLPGIWGEVWYFNPFAWQFLFFAGTAIGTSARWRQAAVPRRRGFVIVAALGIAAIFIVKCAHVLLTNPGFFANFGAVVFQGANDLPAIRVQFPLTGKPNLEPMRLVHFFLLIYLAMVLIPRVAAFWETGFAKLFITCGRHSMTIFCCNTVLVYIANVVILSRHSSALAQFFCNVMGWSVLLALGWLLAHSHRALWRGFVGKLLPRVALRDHDFR